ncbi:bacteriocin immunity protein [Vagococcus acidifermentans]|uniref:Bacteriocin immunity protein n=1 Tax=Vagococcus acidifermentans TaxID=564710 RepID=A0A430AWV5_9ENTE|nr:bacteriocin immunity protein [Vagococcus acidifermentans]RSU12516.1 bacteriocin immunity protein [Vagococcus acidifermentans]
MEKLKWFSGGKDRGNQALTLITELLKELSNDPKSNTLQNVLLNYKDELERKQSAVPHILSRMNLDISSAIRKDQLSLSHTQSSVLNELTTLSTIRYGY